MNATIIVDPVHSKALPDLVTKLLTARQESLVLYQNLRLSNRWPSLSRSGNISCTVFSRR